MKVIFLDRDGVINKDVDHLDGNSTTEKIVKNFCLL